MPPWNYHPDLTRERLIRIAQLMARGRGHALDRHEPDIGDDAWTHGVRAFRYCCHEVTVAAGAIGFEWLSILNPGRRYQFKVGEAPLRFYRGAPEQPKANMLHLTEFEQFLLPFAEPGILFDVKLRIAVDTDTDGTILGVYFVAVRAQEVETVWRIPFETAPPLIVDLARDLEPPVELDAPEVGLWEDEEEEDDDAEGGAA